MLRFLTDELQDAEDQGDRGMSFLRYRPHVSMKTSAISLDYRSCSQWLGWSVLTHLKR